jgi:hypothetical protein
MFSGGSSISTRGLLMTEGYLERGSLRFGYIHYSRLYGQGIRELLKLKGEM